MTKAPPAEELRHSSFRVAQALPAVPAPPAPAGEGGASAAGIVLSWLIRLRWFAVVGQLIAIVVALAVLKLAYPMWPLAAVLAVTLLSNAALVAWQRTLTLPRWLTAAVLVLDVGLLTALLYFTGGPQNPFAVLYVVHVAMATVVLGPAWTWAIVLIAAACYGLITWRHHPLAPAGGPVPAWAQVLGQWTALLLVVWVMAYFIGRIMLALRTRERELADVRERAALSERLASLTTLAAGAAHELGTPLGTIALVAKEMELEARQRAARESAGEGDSLAEDAALVRQQVERCREILERMRGDIAGRSSDEPGRCDPADVVRAVVAQLGPEGQRLDVAVTPGVPDVAAPLRATQQAVALLVNNAFDASPRGERVRLAVTTLDGQVCFEVRDRGSGMGGETLRRAAEPFFTTKEPGRGMGLGLFLVRLVADRNGGRLLLSSSPGEGTVARLDLPAAAP